MRRNFYQRNIGWYAWAILSATILSLFLPSLAYATDSSSGVVLNPTSSASIFTLAPYDQSVLYLEELFGNVPPILAGTGSQLMAQLFKVFNTAVLTLGILIAGYTTFVGILNTAGEGEMLGKGWSSIWIPIRTVAGIALLIPTGSGYCVCQVFMMWLLVQGIGAADSLTGTIVNYMESGMKVFVPATGIVTGTNNTDPLADKYSYYNGTYNGASTGSSVSTAYDSTIQTIFQGLSCMQSYQKDYPTTNPDYMQPTVMTSSSAITYDFIAYKPASSGNVNDPPQSISCGQMAISMTDSSSSPDNSTIAPFIQQGFNAIIPSLNSVAYFMVNNSSSDEGQVMQSTFDFVGGAGFLSDVERVYSSFAGQANNAVVEKNTNTNTDDYYEDIRSLGWVSLGSVYWKMAKSKGSASDNVLSEAIVPFNTNQNIGNTDFKNDYDSNAWTYGNTWATQFINDLNTSRNSSDGSTYQSSGKQDPAKIGANAMAAITMGTLYAMEEKLSGSNNPMVAAQELGHNVSLIIEIVSATIAAALLATAAWAGSMSSISPGYLVYQTAIAIILPGLAIFMGVILVLAGTLSVVIPFIPALAYFFAVIAWLIAALETIVAAPIVAIGVIHPDGQHHVWGKAEPAIMLMTNMFLRPSFIVIGMAAGIILSFITMQFVNFGFNQVLQQILGGKAPTTIESIVILTTYVGIVMACVNKSFSAIDAIPEQVMRWIQGGEGAKLGSGQDAMQKVQQGQEGQAKQSGEAAAQNNAAEKGGRASDAVDNMDAQDDARDQREADGFRGKGIGRGRGGNHHSSRKKS